jgi:hypothetical protein
VAGDCRTKVCDGAGGTTTQADAGDVLDDGNACTRDTCVGGTPANDPASPGDSCAQGSGVVCDGLGACVECLASAECLSLVCQAGSCVPAACDDRVVNGQETDLDCGGAECGACGNGQLCMAPRDCMSGVCSGTCRAPSCSDGVKNGAETDLDCGGVCPMCGPGKGCAVDQDCVGGSCSGTVCLPTCTDGVKNADETSVDCGGATCAQCGDLEACVGAADCQSGVCAGDLCQPARCGDGVAQAGEQCDDWNQVNTDACTNACPHHRSHCSRAFQPSWSNSRES